MNEPSRNSPLLELRGVSRYLHTHGRKVCVLHDINLTIDAGEVLAILGPSGSGKSTLLNLLGCLDRPDAGSYRIAGQETNRFSNDEMAAQRRERFGFVFQRYHLLNQCNARENVELPGLYRGTPRTLRHERARQLLAQLGLAERLQHRPEELSGGQQQRVSIARALMNGGAVLLADEPTGALDSENGAAVLRTLLALNAEGMTLVLVTHDESLAARAHRVVRLHDGRIVADHRNPASAAASTPTTLPALPAPGPRRMESVLAVLLMSWRMLLTRRLRTLLTFLSVVIGVTSVVAIMALGEGARRDILKQVAGMGVHSIDIYPGADWGDSDAAAIHTLVPADAKALQRLPYVDSVTPEMRGTYLIRRRSEHVTAQVSGVGEEFFQARGLRLSEGRGFDVHSIRRQAPIAVIDLNLRRRLFGPSGVALGQVLLVDSLPCTIVGVVTPSDVLASDSGTLNLWLPYSTAAGRLFGRQFLDSITLRIKPGQPSDIAEQNIVSLMRKRHGIKDFYTENADAIVRAVDKTSRSLSLLVSLVALVSLLVGGLGVMNVMLVSVTERTREIGIRLALGARQADILRQFLTEAVMICLPAGAAGILLSLGLQLAMSAFDTPWQMLMSGRSILMAFLCSTLVGILFGFFPAWKASRLDPATALTRD